MDVMTFCGKWHELWDSAMTTTYPIHAAEEPAMAFVAASPFSTQFASLVESATQEELKELSRMLSPRVLQPREVLVREGAESDALYFVLSGRLTASLTNEDQTVELGGIGPGEWVGEVSMIDPGPATATVTAEEETHLLRLGQEEFRKLTAANSTLANALLRSLCAVLIDRLRATGVMLFEPGLPHQPPDGASAHARSWFLGAYRQLLGIRGDRL